MIKFLEFSWLTLLNVGFMFLLLLLCFILLTFTDQGRDFMDAMVQDGFTTKFWKNSIFFILLFGWCYLCWYVASLILQVDPYTGNFDLTCERDLSYFKKSAKNTSYFIGILPAVLVILNIIITGYLCHKKFNFSKEFPFIALSLLVLIAALLLFIKRDHTADPANWPVDPVINHNDTIKCPEYNTAAWSRFKYLADGLCYIKTYSDIRFYFKWVGSIALVVLVLFFFRDINIRITTTIGPASTALLCFMFLTFVFSVLYYFHDIQSFPSALIIMFLVLTFSFWNDNTRPEKLPEQEKRHDIKTAFNKWFDANLANDTSNEIPVYLVAAQGGGIRGMKWTGIVLDELNRRSKGDFMKHTFCMSGVSGGGVGELLYLSYLHDGQKESASFNEFLSGDYLSPVLASYAFPEMLQKIVPYRIEYVERAKTLGYAWAKGYEHHIGKNTLSESFLGLWYKNNSFNTSIPSVFINGTLAETGERVITSNLELPASKTFEYHDFYKGSYGDIRTYAAALNCCRFSGITPGALYVKNNKALGHIIDGGFRENTGIGTLVMVLNEIRTEFKSKNKNIKPYIIYIKNGENSREEKPAAMTLGHDLGTAFSGLLHSVGTGKSENLFIELVRQQEAAGLFKFEGLYLDSHRVKREITLPLGWYLSDSASKEIDNSMLRMFNRNKFCENISQKK